MSFPRPEVEARVTRAILSTARTTKKTIEPSDSLVFSLGFDSLSVANLAIALETELERPVFLSDWFARCGDPAALTVGSLCNFIWEEMQGDG